MAAGIERGATAVPYMDVPQRGAVFDSTRNRASLQISGASIIYLSSRVIYKMQALQDGVTFVSWVSYHSDLTDAPVGHSYTVLSIESYWTQ